MQQLLQTNEKGFRELEEKSPIPDCKFVNVDGIRIMKMSRDSKTLLRVKTPAVRTVKFLVLKTWIK